MEKKLSKYYADCTKTKVILWANCEKLVKVPRASIYKMVTAGLQ